MAFRTLIFAFFMVAIFHHLTRDSFSVLMFMTLKAVSAHRESDQSVVNVT